MEPRIQCVHVHVRVRARARAGAGTGSGSGPLLRALSVRARPGRTPGSDRARHPRQPRSLGSERGLATPSPDGKGEIPLGPSLKIMPVDSYSTLGRSCEPAFKWIPDPGQAPVRARAARQRQALAGGWSALGGQVNCSFTWSGSSSEVQPPDPGSGQLTGSRGPRVPARPEAPNSGIRRCLPALTRQLDLLKRT